MALSPTLSTDFLFSLLRLGVAGAPDAKARLQASCLPGSGVGRRATAPGLCWSLCPPQEPCLGVGQRWPSGSVMSVGGAGLGQAGTAGAALAQPCLSPSVPHGPVSPKSLSPNSCPGWLFRSRCSPQLLRAALGLSEQICTGRGDVCVCSQPAVPKSSASGWQEEACAVVVAVPLSLSRWACPALGSRGMVTPADGTEGAGRERLVREASIWQPAVSSDFTSHSSAPVALPCCRPARALILCPGRSCPRARHTAPSPLAPLCSTPASPSISRLSCPTSPTPRTICLPQCICCQQDGQPGGCFSRYCGRPAPGWCSTAPRPGLGPLTPG